MRIKLIVCIVFSTVLVVSCKTGPKVTDVVSYIKYVENPDNGLINVYKNEDMSLKITAQYKAPEYLAIKEFEIDNYDPDSMVLLANEFKGAYQFGFTISSLTNGYDVLKANLTPKEYVDRITYLSSEVRQDFKLVVGMDTLPCSICHFERTYNVSPNNDFMLVFPTEKTSKEDIKLIYNDKTLGIGKLEFDFRRKSIQNIPSIL